MEAHGFSMRLETRSLGELSTDAVEVSSAESTTMLLVGDVVDDDIDSSWKDILIA